MASKLTINETSGQKNVRRIMKQHSQVYKFNAKRNSSKNQENPFNFATEEEEIQFHEDAEYQSKINTPSSQATGNRVSEVQVKG